MRLNVDDRALRDPDINRRLPRFTGLNRFEAIGRLLHVWGLCYDARSPFALIEDVDDRAEFEGFAVAMVEAGCAERVDDLTIRVRGVEERIGYLTKSAEAGTKGGEKRAKQAAAGGRGAGGRFAKGSTTRPVVSGQGSGENAAGRDHTSGSGSSPAPALDLAPDTLPAAPVAPKPDPANEASRALVAEINAQSGRRFDPDASEPVKLARALLKAGHTVDEGLAVIRHLAPAWMADPKMAEYVRPSTLLTLAKFPERLESARCPPLIRAGPLGTGNHSSIDATAQALRERGFIP